MMLASSKSSADVFNLAFSHEVLHLVRDMNEHAKLINFILKASGSYYAVRSFSKPEVWQMHKEKLMEKGSKASISHARRHS
jgi:hypothetical protein